MRQRLGRAPEAAAHPGAARRIRLEMQGGPGTGKTVVALHRVSWLLYNHRDRLGAADVLVIGPSPTFMRYIRRLLPSLGDEDIRQVDLYSLIGGIRLGRTETPEIV